MVYPWCKQYSNPMPFPEEHSLKGSQRVSCARRYQGRNRLWACMPVRTAVEGCHSDRQLKLLKVSDASSPAQQHAVLPMFTHVNGGKWRQHRLGPNNAEAVSRLADCWKPTGSHTARVPAGPRAHEAEGPIHSGGPNSTGVAHGASHTNKQTFKKAL